MQSREIGKIRERIETARERLLATVDGLDAGAWDWRPGDGRWSVRLTLAHVGSAQHDHLRWARHQLSGEPVTLAEFDLDAWNAEHVAGRSDWPIDRVVADLEDAQQQTFALLDALDTSDLQIKGQHPALGTVTVGQVLRVIAVHDGMHRRDIQQLLLEMSS
jgi:uncharacterized damage-inducible protein DinB